MVPEDAWETITLDRIVGHMCDSAVMSGDALVAIQQARAGVLGEKEALDIIEMKIMGYMFEVCDSLGLDPTKGWAP